MIPISLTLLAFAPALVVLGLRAILGSGSVSRSVANAVPYSDYISTIAIVVLVFSVVITPELVCPDRRDRTLSLYFSTAIGRLDYVLGKIAAALMPLLLVTLAPVLLLYVGTVLFSVHPVGYLQAHWLDLPRIIASSLIVATFYGLVGLAISSLTTGAGSRSAVPGLPGHLDGDGRRPESCPERALLPTAGGGGGADPGRPGAVPGALLSGQHQPRRVGLDRGRGARAGGHRAAGALRAGRR